MAQKAPGKSHRKRISVMQVAEMFATEKAAVKWFEDWHWPTGKMACMRCGSTERAYRVKGGKLIPYRCRDCRKYFSLKTGTAMESSKLPLRMWGWVIYLELTNLKGVSAMKLHRDLGISYPSAWLMLHRIREALADMRVGFEGLVEVDESYFDDKRANMSNAKRKELEGTGREHETVKHSAAEYVRYLEGATIPHQWGGAILVHAQAGAQGRLPPAQPEAPDKPTSTRSRDGTTSGTSTRWPRFNMSWPDWSGSGSCTGSGGRQRTVAGGELRRRDETPRGDTPDIEPGNNYEIRTKRRNELNAVRNHIDLWLTTFDNCPQGGPYRNEMQAAVDQLVEELKCIRPD